jgi:hypothetical protein
MKGKNILYQPEHQGILQDFKKTDSSELSFNSNAITSSYKPENLLNYDNNTLFNSNREPNSWFSIQLKTQKIIPSGYLLRSYSQGLSAPKTWKLEGSNDNYQWIIIDQQENRDWMTKEWSEVYFPVQTKEAFSYFKFTQPGKNYNNYDALVLN